MTGSCVIMTYRVGIGLYLERWVVGCKYMYTVTIKPSFEAVSCLVRRRAFGWGGGGGGGWGINGGG